MLRPLPQPVVRHHLGDETDPESLPGLYPPPRDEELHGTGETHHEREPRGEPVARHDVPPALEAPELRALGRDADVGEQRRLQARREADPAPGRDPPPADVDP